MADLVIDPIRQSTTITLLNGHSIKLILNVLEYVLMHRNKRSQHSENKRLLHGHPYHTTSSQSSEISLEKEANII